MNQFELGGNFDDLVITYPLVVSVGVKDIIEVEVMLLNIFRQINLLPIESELSGFTERQ